jgi:hypothetical protein
VLVTPGRLFPRDPGGLRRTGATGLEPATSGVTGRVDRAASGRRPTTQTQRSLQPSGFLSTPVQTCPPCPDPSRGRYGVEMASRDRSRKTDKPTGIVPGDARHATPGPPLDLPGVSTHPDPSDARLTARRPRATLPTDSPRPDRLSLCESPPRVTLRNVSAIGGGDASATPLYDAAGQGGSDPRDGPAVGCSPRGDRAQPPDLTDSTDVPSAKHPRRGRKRRDLGGPGLQIFEVVGMVVL